jgi:hypothetical protein
VADSPAQINVADVLAVDASVALATGSAEFGITSGGFNPKPFARLLAEKLALARSLFGDGLDLTSSSAIRKLLEVSALEDARTWAALSSFYDDSFVSTATATALSRLGEEVGLPRPYLEARGIVTLTLAGDLPAGDTDLEIPRGARMLTPGGHHVATDQTVRLSPTSQTVGVPVVAFYPGPETNLDPTIPDQKVDRWNELDDKLADLLAARAAASASGSSFDVTITHTVALSGGELQWPDTRYRDLLLRAPRSVWTADAIEVAIALVPGVRQVQVRDAWGGLDINQSIFGDFAFIERLFSSERDLGSPYYLTILVAPTPAAIWDGPDGLRASVESAIEDLRPISIFPNVEQGDVVGIGIAANLVVRGVPLPSGNATTVNASQAAADLKQRLLDRARRYVDALMFGDPVRASEVTWALMGESGLADVQELRLLRYPAHFDELIFGTGDLPSGVAQTGGGDNITLGATEIAVFVDDDSQLRIV